MSNNLSRSVRKLIHAIRLTGPAVYGQCEIAARHSVNSTVRRLREHKRSRTTIPAHISVGDVFLPVTLADITAYGAGLRGQSGYFEGSEVQLWLSNGERIQGTVVWARNGSGGIQFAQALPDNHPFLQSAQSSPNSGPSRPVAAKDQLSLPSPEKWIERNCREHGFSWLVEEP